MNNDGRSAFNMNETRDDMRGARPYMRGRFDRVLLVFMPQAASYQSTASEQISGRDVVIAISIAKQAPHSHRGRCTTERLV